MTSCVGAATQYMTDLTVAGVHLWTSSAKQEAEKRAKREEEMREERRLQRYGKFVCVVWFRSHMGQVNACSRLWMLLCFRRAHMPLYVGAPPRTVYRASCCLLSLVGLGLL